MISETVLDRRFEVIDSLLDTITECEAALNALLTIEQDIAVPLPVAPPTADVPSPTAHRFLQSMAEIDGEGALAKALAERIRAARKRKGWRQQDLADATGIARPNIARIESGRRIPKITTLQRIAGALDLSIESIAVT
jgi:DNA-binding XRE family transcriptional regulator